MKAFSKKTVVSSLFFLTLTSFFTIYFGQKIVERRNIERTQAAGASVFPVYSDTCFNSVSSGLSSSFDCSANYSNQSLGLGKYILAIDFAPIEPTVNILQKTYPDNELIVQQIAGSEYRTDTQLQTEYQATDKSKTYDQWLAVTYKKLALAKKLKANYENHGANVASSMLHTWDLLGKEGLVLMEPLQSVFNPANVSGLLDSLGNVGAAYKIPATFINNIIKNYPDQKIVDMSFMVGVNKVFLIAKFERIVNTRPENTLIFGGQNGESLYCVPPNNTDTTILGVQTQPDQTIMCVSGGVIYPPLSEVQYQQYLSSTQYKLILEYKEPRLEIIEAYSKDLIQASMLEVKNIIESNPDKFFIMAAGNVINSELRKLDLYLTTEDRSRVLFVAQYGEAYGHEGSLIGGADVYVWNQHLGLKDGSSFSTPFIGALAANLLDKGNTVNELRSKILSLCSTYESSVDCLFDETVISTLK